MTRFVVDSPLKATTIKAASDGIAVVVVANPFFGDPGRAADLADSLLLDAPAPLENDKTQPATIVLTEPDVMGDLYAHWASVSLGLTNVWRAPLRSLSREGLQDAVRKATRIRQASLEAAQLHLLFERIGYDWLPDRSDRLGLNTSALALLKALASPFDGWLSNDPLHRCRITSARAAEHTGAYFYAHQIRGLVSPPEGLLLEVVERRSQRKLEAPPDALSYAALVEAARYGLGVGPGSVWLWASALYEEGLITYPFVHGTRFDPAYWASCRDLIQKRGWPARPDEDAIVSDSVEDWGIHPVSWSDPPGSDSTESSPGKASLLQLIRNRTIQAMMPAAAWGIETIRLKPSGPDAGRMPFEFEAHDVRLLNPGYRRYPLDRPVSAEIAGFMHASCPSLAIGDQAVWMGLELPESRTPDQEAYMSLPLFDAHGSLLKSTTALWGRLRAQGYLEPSPEGDRVSDSARALIDQLKDQGWPFTRAIQFHRAAIQAILRSRDAGTMSHDHRLWISTLRNERSLYRAGSGAVSA